MKQPSSDITRFFARHCLMSGANIQAYPMAYEIVFNVLQKVLIRWERALIQIFSFLTDVLREGA